MAASNASADCAILTAWQPTKFSAGCCNPASNCDSAGRIQRLSLNFNQLTGPIPTEFGRLTSLSYLALALNQLTGPIPTELGRLTSLTLLNLASNQLTGPIPTELGQLASLSYFGLASNQLTGPIPTELGRLTSLTFFGLTSNQLTGPIPTELGRLTSLTFLDLHSNQLTGSIPTELGQLTSLDTIRLDSNRLNGNIPCEFSNWKVLSISNFTANPLESTTFNARACKSVTASLPTTLTATASTSINASPLCNNSTCEQQKSIVPIVGGVVGAVILGLAIALGIWYRQKRSKNQPDQAAGDTQFTVPVSGESFRQFPSSSSPTAPDSLQGSEKVAFPSTNPNDFPTPEKVSLFNHLESLPQERKFEDMPSLKAALPTISKFTIPPNSVTVSGQSSKINSQSAALDLPSNSLGGSSMDSSSRRMALPENPRDWNEDETAQWILERFGDSELSSLALSQNINGRALLMLERQHITSALKLETVGRQLLFEEAVAELRRQSAQQSALAQENPPSYE
ncbi:hypothetical protein BJ741DRAFT_226370 [Chytriomyces cf. hyalinus JEL632]|nr:hypothetical protein BJ741DRAFT_226370 [Chytriomyces cf. hyalinus JEL632]